MMSLLHVAAVFAIAVVVAIAVAAIENMNDD